MDKVFVDTSGWVALFVANDVNHAKAVDIFHGLKTNRSALFTSDYIFDETVTTILVRGDHRQSLFAGDALLNSQVVKIAHVSPDHFQPAWEMYRKYADKRFSFTDATSFAIMRGLGIEKVFCFDRGFSRAGFQTL